MSIAQNTHKNIIKQLGRGSILGIVSFLLLLFAFYTTYGDSEGRLFFTLFSFIVFMSSAIGYLLCFRYNRFIPKFEEKLLYDREISNIKYSNDRFYPKLSFTTFRTYNLNVESLYPHSHGSTFLLSINIIILFLCVFGFSFFDITEIATIAPTLTDGLKNSNFYIALIASYYCFTEYSSVCQEIVSIIKRPFTKHKIYVSLENKLYDEYGLMKDKLVSISYATRSDQDLDVYEKNLALDLIEHIKNSYYLEKKKVEKTESDFRSNIDIIVV